MNFIRKLIGGDSATTDSTHNCGSTSVCYTVDCSERRFLCDKCEQRHFGHRTSPIKEYKSKLARFQTELGSKQKLQQLIDGYLNKIREHVEKLCSMARSHFLERAYKVLFTREFTQAQEKYLKNGDYLPDLYGLTFVPTKEVLDQLNSKLHELQRRMSQSITPEALCISPQDFDILKRPEQPLERITKIDQLQDLLPFHCKLTLRFQASANNFLTKNLYSLNLQGPILVLIQSRAKTFGGYSPNMWTVRSQFVQDKRGQSFLFSIDDCEVLPIKPEFKKYSVHGGVNWGFGRGDLCVSEEGNKASINWADAGHVYQGLSTRLNQEKRWLAGSWYFRTLQYEIYEVTGIKKK